MSLMTLNHILVSLKTVISQIRRSTSTMNGFTMRTGRTTCDGAATRGLTRCSYLIRRLNWKLTFETWTTKTLKMLAFAS